MRHYSNWEADVNALQVTSMSFPDLNDAKWRQRICFACVVSSTRTHGSALDLGQGGASPKQAKGCSRQASLSASLPFLRYHQLSFFFTSSTMAVARPIRMLGAACILLCLFLLFQLNQGPTSLGSRLLNGMKKDPLLDRG